MAEKLEWEKQIQQAVKREHRFGVSVRNKNGKCFIQRYYKDRSGTCLSTANLAARLFNGLNSFDTSITVNPLLLLLF